MIIKISWIHDKFRYFHKHFSILVEVIDDLFCCSNEKFTKYMNSVKVYLLPTYISVENNKILTNKKK